MTLQGKVETDVEIKASADKFHEIFASRPHHTSKITPNKIHGVDLHHGDWGKSGSTISWKYFHDGKSCEAKEIVEAIDDKNRSITFRVIEGDIMEAYKSFVITYQATPKGEGSVVHFTIEYERLHQGVDHPENLLQFINEITKDIEAHLIEEESKKMDTEASSTASTKGSFNLVSL